jgi:hypothetical protein
MPVVGGRDGQGVEFRGAGRRDWSSVARTALRRPSSGPVEFQHGYVFPGVERVVVDQFQQRVIHLRSEPWHLRGRQDVLGLRRDQRDDQQVEARESRPERCGADLIGGVRPGRGHIGEVVQRRPVEDDPGRQRRAQAAHRACQQCPVILQRWREPELIPLFLELVVRLVRHHVAG